MAAVLACGEEALLSGCAAAYLLGILKGKPPPPEVTAPRRRDVAGVRTRRARHAEGIVWRGIPVTSAARTLVDLAAELEEEDLARVCHEAGVRHHTKPRQVEAILARRPNTPGAAKLRAVMCGDVKVVLSRMERRVVSLLRHEGFELPETNRRAGSHRVDMRWPKKKLTVELDSYGYHNSRYSWKQDRKREREARVRGDEFRRFIPEEVFDNPAPMMAELRTLLS
jgi:hypothetical protein